MKLDIHNFQLRLEQELKNLKNSSASGRNKELILKFYNDCSSADIGIPRLTKLVESTRSMANMLKIDYDDATVDDLKALVRYIDSQNWSVWTKATHKKILKKFYKWLKGKDDEYPPEVKWLKANPKPKDVPRLSQQDLITPEEIKKAIDCSDHPRNKAFLAVLSETGCRIGELGSLRMKDVSFEKMGAILNVNGKTGPRRIMIIKSVPYLATWLNSHPFKSNLDSQVWINVGTTNHHDPMMYNALNKMIRDAFKAAGIKKRCNPHLFRHTRATQVAPHMTEFQMKQYFGWTQGSDMAGTYVHLCGRDVDDAILKLNGMTVSGEKQIEAKPKICTRCGTINISDSTYCMKCAAILDEKIAMREQNKLLDQQSATNKINEIMGLLVKNPEVLSYLTSKAIELGLKEKLQQVP